MRKIAEFCDMELNTEMLNNRLAQTCPESVRDVLYFNPRKTNHTGAERSRRKENQAKRDNHSINYKEQPYVYRKYDLEGKYIAEYDTLEEAASSIKLGAFNIDRVISGMRKQAGGFQWKKEERNSDIADIEALHIILPDGKGKAVCRIDENGEVLERYESVAAASRKIGVNAKSIRYAAIGIQKKAGGFYWAYE